MVRKRMKGDEADDGTEVDEDGKKVKKKKSKDFVRPCIVYLLITLIQLSI